MVKDTSNIPEQFELNKQKLRAIWESIKNNDKIYGYVELKDSENVLDDWTKIKQTFTETEGSSQPDIVNLYYNTKENSKCLIEFLRNEKGGFGSIGTPRLEHLFNEGKNFDKKLLELKLGKSGQDNEKSDGCNNIDIGKKVKGYFTLYKTCLEIPSLENIDKKYKEAQENKLHGAPIVFHKIVIMDHCSGQKPQFDLICINRTESIDILCKKFLGEKCTNDNFFTMNAKLLKKIKEINELKNDTNMDGLKYHLKLSAALWMLANDEDDFPTAESPNVIFYGAPGTGKTYAVKNYMEFNGIKDLDAEDSQNGQGCYRWVQFHPSFTYEDFIEGLKPTGVADNGSIKLELVNGVFKDFCKQAFNGIKESPEKDIPYYFIVDEINRANLSTVFGETLSLLEPSYRDKILDKEGEEIRNLIDIQYSTLERKASNQSDLFYDSKNEGKFGIPRNVRFIGMMNDVDKSIDAFDLALRRRFRWIRKDCDYNVVKNTLLDSEIKEDDINKYIGSCKHLNTYISGLNEKGNPSSRKNSLNLGKSYEFGHSFFLKITEFITNKSITDTAKESLFNNYLSPTLKEYLRSEVSNENDLETKLEDAKKIFIKGSN